MTTGFVGHRFQILLEPVELLLRDVAPVLEQHGRVERDEVDVLVVPRLVQRLPGALDVALLAARVPADVVVARGDVHLRCQRLERVAELLILLVVADLAMSPVFTKNAGARLERLISSNILTFACWLLPTPKCVSDMCTNRNAATAVRFSPFPCPCPCPPAPPAAPWTEPNPSDTRRRAAAQRRAGKPVAS